MLPEEQQNRGGVYRIAYMYEKELGLEWNSGKYELQGF